MIKVYISDKELTKIKLEREKRKQERREHLHYVKILRVASEYSFWLHRKSRGSSYSTFVNEFGYQEKDSSKTFDLVTKILESLKSL